MWQGVEYQRVQGSVSEEEDSVDRVQPNHELRPEVN